MAGPPPDDPFRRALAVTMHRRAGGTIDGPLPADVLLEADRRIVQWASGGGNVSEGVRELARESIRRDGLLETWLAAHA